MKLIFALSFLFSSPLFATKATEKQVDPAQFQVLNITPLKSTIKDAIAELGEAKVADSKDEGHEYKGICYQEASGNRLIFEEGFFIPGVIGRVVMSSTSNVPHRLKTIECVPSAKMGNPKTANGLQLGLTQQQVSRILGTATSRRKGTWKYEREFYRAYTEEEKAAQSNKAAAPGGGKFKGEYRYLNIEAKFQAGKLNYLEIYLSGEADW